MGNLHIDHKQLRRHQVCVGSIELLSRLQWESIPPRRALGEVNAREVRWLPRRRCRGGGGLCRTQVVAPN